MERVINSVAAFLSTAVGFFATSAALVAGIGIGAVLNFDEGFMFGFNLFLSAAAIVISGIILVSAARSEAAIHVKLDYLIECSQATNRTIGIEHKDVAEIEKERAEVESKVADTLEGVVEDEVAEQLSRRPEHA